MYVVLYSIDGSSKVNMGFVNTDNKDDAKRIVFNRLKADNHKSIIIKGAEKTSLNVFLNPEISFLGY